MSLKSCHLSSTSFAWSILEYFVPYITSLYVWVRWILNWINLSINHKQKPLIVFILLSLTLLACTNFSAHIPNQILHSNESVIHYVLNKFYFAVDTTLKLWDIFCTHFITSAMPQKINCSQSIVYLKFRVCTKQTLWKNI